ncbi:unnamed protein product [Ectocarpus sp. 12 AP-2014]
MVVVGVEWKENCCTLPILVLSLAASVWKGKGWGSHVYETFQSVLLECVNVAKRGDGMDDGGGMLCSLLFSFLVCGVVALSVTGEAWSRGGQIERWSLWCRANSLGSSCPLHAQCAQILLLQMS